MNHIKQMKRITNLKCVHINFFTVFHMFIDCRHETVVAKLITLHRYKLIPQVWFHTLHVKTQFK